MLTLKPLDPSQRKLLEQATSAFQEDLLAADHAMTYLQARGIAPDTATKFRLGYVANPPDGFEQYRGWIAIPSISLAGVVSIRFRTLKKDLGPKEPKILGMSGWSTRLFNARAVAEAGDIICITEGEFDAIALEMMGQHAVGVPGSTNWNTRENSHHWRLFSGFRKVLIFGDGDQAGTSFNNKVYESLASSTIAIRVPMPEGQDVNSMFLDRYEELAEKIEEFSR